MSTPLTFNPTPYPSSDKVVNGRDREKYPDPREKDPNEYLMSTVWLDSLNQQATRVATSPLVINRITDDDANAAVATSDLVGSTQGGGLYETKAYQRIKTVDGVSSSTQITIGWTDGGVLQSETFTALTGDTTTTKMTGPAKTFRSDSGTPITYAISYASNTPAKMHYEVDILLSRLSA